MAEMNLLVVVGVSGKVRVDLNFTITDAGMQLLFRIF